MSTEREINISPKKNTLIVNLFAGPGAGKTTCSWLIAAELKKQNIVTEYVPEYAKELVWDGNLKRVDGSYESESEIFAEKQRRINRLVGKVDVVVTDSPLLQSACFVLERKEDFKQKAIQTSSLYNNFNLFVERGKYYEKAGRIHSLHESKTIDEEIKKLLDSNDIYYGTYSHNNLDTVVKNIKTTLRKLQITMQNETFIEGASKHKQLTSTLTDVDSPQNERQRLFVDMDGTLTVFTPVDELETLYQKGYFSNLAPHKNVIEAIKEIILYHSDIVEVYSLSAYLTDSDYALQEKNEWLDEYEPEIDQAHRIFVPCGSDKKEGVPGGVRYNDFLLDDFTENLKNWHPSGRGIKLLNAINHTRGSWEHDRIRYDREPKDLANGILSVMRNEQQIFDKRVNDLEKEEQKQMAQTQKMIPTGAKPAPTELAERIFDFLENHDPDLGYAESKEQWIRTITGQLLQNHVANYITALEELPKRKPEIREEADSLIREIRIYMGEIRDTMTQEVNEMPVAEIATLDFVGNPEREGTGGVYRGSSMFEALFAHAAETNYAEFYGHGQYDNAWWAANLKDNFQPKIAILQLGESDTNRGRRFIGTETLNNVLHERPNCSNYELVYVRNEIDAAKTEDARDEINNRLYQEFNADIPRPRTYYGHSMSVGDVIVIVNDFIDQSAYYVDSMGFTKLPDDFLSHEMSAKIRNDLDIRKENDLYESIIRYETENSIEIADKSTKDRYFDITTNYLPIFEMADRRGVIMDMDDLGYAPAQIDGFSEDFLMFRAKDNVKDTFGYDGWDAVFGFIHDVRTLATNYTLQELQDRANGDYGTIEYGTYGDREVQTAIAAYGHDQYENEWWAAHSYLKNDLIDRYRNTEFLNVGSAENQDNAYVSAEEYLSGDIQAKLVLANAALPLLPSLAVNVEALEAAIQIERGEQVGEPLKEQVEKVAQVEQDERTSQDEDIVLLPRDKEKLIALENEIAEMGAWLNYYHQFAGARAFTGRNPLYDREEKKFATLKAQYETLKKGAVKNVVEAVTPNQLHTISVSGHMGTWYVIDQDTIDGKRVLLLESEQHGDEAAALIVDENLNLLLDDVYNGFDDYREQVSEPLKEQVIEAMAAAGYTYNETESGDGHLNFNGDNGSMNFEYFSETAEWINSVTFDDPNISKAVEQIMHPDNEPTTIITDEQMRRMADILAINAKYHYNAIIRELSAREVKREDISINADFKDYTVEELRKAVDFVRNYTPRPFHYYEPDLDLDGTSEELYTDAENGYIENPDALHRLGEILTQEGKADEAERVGFMEERQNEDTSLYSVAQMKLDFMDGYGGIDEVAVSDNANLTVVYEPKDNNVLVSLTQTWQDGNEDVLSTGANLIPLDEFKKMSRADFERFVGEVSAYSMEEQERTPREPIQERTHGDNEKITLHIKYQEPISFNGLVSETDRIVFDNQDELNKFVNGEVAYDVLDDAVRKRGNEILLYAENENGDVVWGSKEERQEELTIDGHNCVKVDEWVSGSATFILGQSTEDNTFYHAQVSDTDRDFGGVYAYEYSGMPSHDDVESNHMDNISAIAIDRHEEEYGADGRRAFPHMNDEPPRDYREAVTLIEGMSNTQIADMGYDEASNLISLLDNERLNNEGVLQEVMETGYDETYTQEYVQQLDYDMEYYRQLSDYVEELAIGQYVRGELREVERPVRQIVELQVSVPNEPSLTINDSQELIHGEEQDNTLTFREFLNSHRGAVIAAMTQGGHLYLSAEQTQDYEKLTSVVSHAGSPDTRYSRAFDDELFNATVSLRRHDEESNTYHLLLDESEGERLREHNHRDNEIPPQDAPVNLVRQTHAQEIATEMPEKKEEELSKEISDGDNDNSPKDRLREQLDNGIRSVLDSENFKNWLSSGGKLYYKNYSFQNAMLVWLQKPDASYVMGYEKWKEFGRNVVQGAKGAKIFIPIMAGEKYKGGLYRSIKSNLIEQLSKDPSLTEATYRLGTSNLEFTMNRSNRLVGFKANGAEQFIFASDDEAKRFIERTIVGKVPTGFAIGTVFDAKDVTAPEYLWVKSGFTKEEIATDAKGNPIKNRRGETKIVNTTERQARFQTDLDMEIVANDPVKMQKLFDACMAASERKGVPVILADKENDSTLNDGEKGYFSREFSEEHPNGFIVIDNNLEVTRKCAVLLHEMGHADLHKNLEALAQKMGEKRISQKMREIQAEATAFAVASTFGIETDTSSFSYLAIYSKGFELQDFHKSIEVIYKETQALTADIKAELDIRGLNLDLTEKPKEKLDKQTLATISTKYMDFAEAQGNDVQAALSEMPGLIRQSKDNPDRMDVLKYQKENLDSRKMDIEIILNTIESLNEAATREQQDERVNILDATMSRISGNSSAFENLTERYLIISERAQGDLKVDFEKDPIKTLEAMKKDYPALTKLSEPQLQYVATSKFVSREFAKLLRDNPQEFVDKVTERATLLPRVAAKNGTFVEVNRCEQWTDKPFFEKGTLCSPKIADVVVAGSETQMRGFRSEAEKRGEYFPIAKCDITVYTPDKNNGLISLNTRIDIGDGEQKGLKDHLEQICRRGVERKEVLANFQEALTERASKNKIKVQDVSKKTQKAESPDKEAAPKGDMTQKQWREEINGAREQDVKEHVEKTAEKSKSNPCRNGE